MITKHILPILLLCAAFFTAASRAFAAETPEQIAQSVAEQWLALIDDGKFAESWQGAAGYFKAAVSEPQWKASLDGVRKPLGSLVTRKLKSAKYSNSVPGVPNGQFVLLQFDTTFANKKKSVETVTPMIDKDGKWRVSGYFVR